MKRLLDMLAWVVLGGTVLAVWGLAASAGGVLATLGAFAVACGWAVLAVWAGNRVLS